MAEQQCEHPEVFIRRLLSGLIRELENCNGRSDHIDSVLYRIDWLYNSLVRYLGVYDSVSDQLISFVRDAKDLLQISIHQTRIELSRFHMEAADDRNLTFQETR